MEHSSSIADTEIIDGGGCNGLGQAVQVSYRSGRPARFCNTYTAYSDAHICIIS